MSRDLHITATCVACGVLGEGDSSDPATTRKPANLAGDWTRWAELDRLADKHTKPGHATCVSVLNVRTTGAA